MADRIEGLGLPRVPHGTVPQGAKRADGPAFVQLLDAAEAAQAVKFSAHAQQRLAQAEVQLGPQAMSRLEAAVQKAGQKGGKESLILLDDLAFVVSVKNRTVITAVGADRMADNVFTNIDSVVIAGEQPSTGEAGAQGVSSRGGAQRREGSE
jgi:flagellar operon protein